MDGKQNIIDKILLDAQTQCEQILQQANQKADDIRNKAQQTIDKQLEQLQEKLKQDSVDIVNNTLSNARLDASKYALQQKQQLIDKVFQECYNKLVALQGKEYQQFVVSLLRQYAENGEIVRIRKEDSKLITQDLISSCGKQLTLSKEYIDIDGGVVLEGNGYDKNLSLSMLIKYQREQHELSVAKILFG